MSKTANVCWFLLGMSAYQLITEAELFHWLRPVLCLAVVLMFSSICLLMRPISLFAGLMRRHVGLFSKLSLWSFEVMKACRSAMHSALSSMWRLVAMFLASLLMLWMMLVLAFL